MNQPKSPFYQPVRNSSTNIGGWDYSGHALDRMQDKGIMPSVVQNAIKYGTSASSYGATTKYFDAINNVSVVVNDAGKIITVTYGK